MKHMRYPGQMRQLIHICAVFLCVGLAAGLLSASDKAAAREGATATNVSAKQAEKETKTEAGASEDTEKEQDGKTAAQFRPEIEDLVSDEPFLDIQQVTSARGLTAWLVEDHSLPLLTLKFHFRGAGAANDPEDKQGLARMVSNTLDEGAADLDSDAFRTLLSDHSISLSFSAGRDHFGGTVYTLKENQDLAFDLLHKALTEPRFDPDPVERMRAANMSRIRSSLTDPDWLAARLFNDVVFDNHPYEKNSGGTLTTLQAITPEDLRTYTKNYLTRDRLVITAAGDIDKKSLSDALDRIFADLPETGKESPVEDTRVKNAGDTVLYKNEIPQTIIKIAHPAIGRDHPDYYAFRILNFIYGGSGFGSRLMEEVREERGLTYGIYSSLYLLDHAKLMTISTSTANKNTRAVLEIIKDELERIKTAPVSENEIQSAKSYLIGSMPISLTSISGIASTAQSVQIDNLPIDYLDHVDEKIAAVTAADIQRIAAKILNPDSLTTVMVGMPEEIEPTQIVEDLPNVE